jgi:succinate-acetate transporter protein
MKTISKIFLAIVAWFMLLDLAQYLINYPSDISFFGGWATILVGIFCTYYLINYKSTKKNNEKTI